MRTLKVTAVGDELVVVLQDDLAAMFQVKEGDPILSRENYQVLRWLAEPDSPRED